MFPDISQVIGRAELDNYNEKRLSMRVSNGVRALLSLAIPLATIAVFYFASESLPMQNELAFVLMVVFGMGAVVGVAPNVARCWKCDRPLFKGKSGFYWLVPALRCPKCGTSLIA